MRTQWLFLTFLSFAVAPACEGDADSTLPQPQPDASCEGSGCGEPGSGGSGGSTPKQTGGRPANAAGTGGNSTVRPDASAEAASGGTTHDASIDAGGSDAGLHDAGSIEAGPSFGDGSCAAIGTWPPSPTAADPSCTPNADAGIDLLCPTSSLPCDTGCCADAKKSLVLSPLGPGGLGGPAWTTVAVSPSGHAYYSAIGGDIGGSNSDFLLVSSSNPTVTPYTSGAKPDMRATVTGLIGQAETPRFAFGKLDGQEAVYATYVAGPPEFVSAAPRGRFGTLVAGAWSFEPVPQVPISLAADASGAALVLVRDGILRHRGKGSWESVCLPDPLAGAPMALATDASDAFYVARIGTDGIVRVSRRDPNGSWTTEAVTTGSTPATVAAVAVGDGTVHVAYSAGTGDLHYARRVGTSWVSHAVAASLPNAPFNPIYLAVDSCGAPHVATSSLFAGTRMDSHYFRWTQAGWRGTVAPNVFDPNGSGGLALTSTHALFSYWAAGFYLAAVPLRAGVGSGGTGGAGGSGNGGAGGTGAGGTGGSSSGGTSAGGSGGSNACTSTVTPPPSCAGLARNCGADQNDDCCVSLCMPGGAFSRYYEDSSSNAVSPKSYPVTLSPVHLDKYEVTVGRFRKFAAALAGGFRPNQGDGKHPHLNGGRGVTTVPAPDGSVDYESGWDTAWNSQLPSTWTAPQNDPSFPLPGNYSTWTPAAGSNEKLPINHVNFYQAYAFCIWDGGFLPTDAEAYCAAAGGREARLLPWWSPDAGSTTADPSYASYQNWEPIDVGDRPSGQGRWGHMDLAGNIEEWNLDGFTSSRVLPALPCNDCTFMPQGLAARGVLGGNYFDSLYSLVTVLRQSQSPGTRSGTTGIRCARP